MGIELKVIHSKYTSKNWVSLPRVGINIEWLNTVFLATLDRSSLCFSVDEAPPSLIKKIKTLPKWSYEFDYAGRRIIIKSAPIIEALLTWPQKGKSLTSLMKLLKAQMDEIRPPFTELEIKTQKFSKKIKAKY